MTNSTSDQFQTQPTKLGPDSRTLSAQSLRERMSKLGNPVAALQANVEYVLAVSEAFCLTRTNRFVPPTIPRKRRLQTLAVAVWSCMIVITTSLWLLLWYAAFAFSRLLSHR